MYIEDISELNVLVKVFYALKFGIDDDELNRIVRSPFFGKIFNEALVELTDRYKYFETIDNSVASMDYWKLEYRKKERERILEYLREIPNWNSISETVQKQIIRDALSPLIFEKRDVNNLLMELNDSYNC